MSGVALLPSSSDPLRQRLEMGRRDAYQEIEGASEWHAIAHTKWARDEIVLLGQLCSSPFGRWNLWVCSLFDDCGVEVRTSVLLERILTKIEALHFQLPLRQLVRWHF